MENSIIHKKHPKKETNWKFYRAYIPNGITCARMIVALFLVLQPLQSSRFIMLYLLCGATDVLDGMLARRWKVQSRLGARLDSLADFIFIIIVLVKVLPFIFIEDRRYQYLVGIVVIVMIRFTTLLVLKFRFHTISWLHTYGNKLTGLCLFVSPLLLIGIGMHATIWFVGSIAFLSAVEELMISIRMQSLDLDIKGLFYKKRKDN